MATIIRAGGSAGLEITFSDSSDTHSVHFSCAGAEIGKTYYILIAGIGDSVDNGPYNSGINNGIGLTNITKILVKSNAGGSGNAVGYCKISFVASAMEFSGDATLGPYFTNTNLVVLISEYAY